MRAGDTNAGEPPLAGPGEYAVRARAADRGLLLERIAAGLAHEAKNPLHNMALHVQLLAEKLVAATALAGPVAPSAAAGAAANSRPAADRHVRALRDGIGTVDALLRAFADLAAPAPAADLGEALSRAQLVLTFEARRRGVTVICAAPASLRVAGAGELVSDLVAHALLAFVALSREGGTVSVEAAREGDRARFTLRAEQGGPPSVDSAAHLAAVQRLAAGLRAELQLPQGVQASARLSLTLPLST